MRPPASLFALVLAACDVDAPPLAPGPDASLERADAETADLTAPPGEDAGVSDLGEPQAPTMRVTSTGPIRGRALGAEIWRFAGIPYAAPPIGPLRFRPPQPVAAWPVPLDASELGPACPQLSGNEFTGNEDCLTLNVWAHRPREQRPMMVWIHGGGHVQGSSRVPIYDGARLAETRGVVVASLNYRLGALGWLVLDELAEERADASVGNGGLLDMQQALTWLQDNAAQFGADPERITLFGESAGGVSILALIGAPSARPRFHRAVIQSGGGGFGIQSPDDALAVGAAFVEAAGCPSGNPLPCLRAATAEDLTRSLFRIPSSGLGLPAMGPVIDGVYLPGQPRASLAEGRVPDLPIIIGSNADEAVNFTRGTAIPDRAAFERVIRSTFVNIAPLILGLYPEARFPVAKDAYNAFVSDLAFNCPAESFARAARGGSAPAFLYAFGHRLNGPAGAEGSLHGHEIPFVFDTIDLSPAYVPSSGDRVVSDLMGQAWTGFAESGAPSTPETLEWPSYVPGASTILRIFGETSAHIDSYREGRCEVFQRIGIIP